MTRKKDDYYKKSLEQKLEDSISDYESTKNKARRRRSRKERE